MGKRNEGHRTDHILSLCCKTHVRFRTTSYGYSIEAWCSKCGNYVFTGRIESLIALWMGDKEAVIKNKGYVPKWVKNE